MKVIILGEKHDVRLVEFTVNNLRAIIKARLNEGWYDDELYVGFRSKNELSSKYQTFKERAEEILNSPVDSNVWKETAFLESRSAYEYEGFSIEEVEEEYR